MPSVIKTATTHKDHNPEITTLDVFSLTHWREKVTHRLWVQLGVRNAPLPPSSGPRSLSWYSHNGWCHLAAATQHREPQGDRGATAAASWVSPLVPPRWKDGAVSSALGAAHPLPASHPPCDLIRDSHAGKEGTWDTVFQPLPWLTGCVPTWKPKATPGLVGMGGADSQQNFG